MAVSKQKELKPRASCTRILENKTELHIVAVRPLNVSRNIKAEDGRWLNTLFISETQIHVFLQINNRLHNRVIFWFCHFASVSAVTVCLQTRGDGWSYFCCFYIWRLRHTRGCHSDCCQGGEEKKRGEEKKIREGKGGGEESASMGGISSERSSAETSRAELEMSEDEGGEVRVRQFWQTSSTATLWSTAGENSSGPRSVFHLSTPFVMFWFKWLDEE